MKYPKGVQWRDDGGREVSEWRYLGTRNVCDGEEVELRARLCRYDVSNGYKIEPAVQFRWKDEWSISFTEWRMVTVVSIASQSIATAKAIAQ